MRLFGEDPDKCQPEEFFGLFDNFLTTFTEARNENEKFRRQREEEERRIRVEAQVDRHNLVSGWLIDGLDEWIS